MNETRFKSLVFFILLAFFVALAKDFYVQVVNSKHFRELYIKSTTHTIKLEGLRGNIFDQKNRALTVNYPSYTFFVDPHYFLVLKKHYDSDEYFKIKLETFLDDISKYLDIKKDSLEKTIIRHSNLQFFVLRKNVGFELFKKISNDPNFIRAFGFVRNFRRYYPDGEFSAHVIGFCYGNGRGAEGLENYYDRYLAGRRLKERVGYDAFKSINRVLPKNGYNIKITLNQDIQDYLHEQLEECVKEHEASKGMAVIMNPNSGAIIAMDSYPFYNNNRYWKYKYEYIKNRVVSDVFEPGSVFKLLTMSAALDSGVFKGDERIYCEKGRWRIKNKVIHDVHRFKTLSFDDVFVYSSNIGSAKIALKLGKKVFYKYLYRFGLGKRTGIDTISESKGLVKDIFNVGDVDLANMAFGQGIGVTEIQLASMYSAIANGGYKVRPHFLEKIFDDNSTIYTYKTDKKQILKPETVQKVKQILKKVVLYGTGKKAALPDYVVAGKTGTAQIAKKGKYTKSYVASFAGFAPFDRPRFVVVVSIFDPKKSGIYGGQVAAPLFAKLMEFTLHYYGVKQDLSKAK